MTPRNKVALFERERAYKSLNWWIRMKNMHSRRTQQTVVNVEIVPKSHHTAGTTELKQLHFHQACEHTTADLHQTHRLQRLIHRAEKDAPPGASATAPSTVTPRFNCIIMFVNDWYDVLWGTFSSRHLSHLFPCFATHRCVRLVFYTMSPPLANCSSLFRNVCLRECGQSLTRTDEDKDVVVSSNLLGGCSDTYGFWI